MAAEWPALSNRAYLRRPKPPRLAARDQARRLPVLQAQLLEIQMQSNNSVPLSKRATNELIEFAIIAAYLYVCFAAVLCLKAPILKAHGIEFAHFGFAAIKALICAKFVSLGQILHVGERLKSLGRHCISRSSSLSC
jgi:hypothetical protein